MIKPRKQYRVSEDISPRGWLRIMMEDDGDVIVTLYGEDILGEYIESSVQFCTFGGGGRYQQVRKALIAVAEAIDAETGGNR